MWKWLKKKTNPRAKASTEVLEIQIGKLEATVRSLRQSEHELQVVINAQKDELAALRSALSKAEQETFRALAEKTESSTLFRSQIESLEKVVDGLSSAYLKRSIFGHQKIEDPAPALAPTKPLPGFMLPSQRTAKLRSEFLREAMDRFSPTPSPVNEKESNGND